MNLPKKVIQDILSHPTLSTLAAILPAKSLLPSSPNHPVSYTKRQWRKAVKQAYLNTEHTESSTTEKNSSQETTKIEIPYVEPLPVSSGKPVNVYLSGNDVLRTIEAFSRALNREREELVERQRQIELLEFSVNQKRQVLSESVQNFVSRQKDFVSIIRKMCSGEFAPDCDQRESEHIEEGAEQGKLWQLSDGRWNCSCHSCGVPAGILAEGIKALSVAIERLNQKGFHDFLVVGKDSFYWFCSECIGLLEESPDGQIILEPDEHEQDISCSNCDKWLNPKSDVLNIIKGVYFCVDCGNEAEKKSYPLDGENGFTHLKQGDLEKSGVFYFNEVQKIYYARCYRCGMRSKIFENEDAEQLRQNGYRWHFVDGQWRWLCVGCNEEHVRKYGERK